MDPAVSIAKTKEYDSMAPSIVYHHQLGRESGRNDNPAGRTHRKKNAHLSTLFGAEHYNRNPFDVSQLEWSNSKKSSKKKKAAHEKRPAVEKSVTQIVEDQSQLDFSIDAFLVPIKAKKNQNSAKF